MNKGIYIVCLILSFISCTSDPDDQIISISNYTIYLESGGFIVLPEDQTGTDNQTLSISTDTLFLERGSPKSVPIDTVNKISEIEYQLKPFTYKLVNTNFGTEAIKITSDGTVWVDRVEIPNYLKTDSLCDIVKCDWRYILIEVKGNRVDFIKKVAPELKIIADSL